MKRFGARGVDGWRRATGRGVVAAALLGAACSGSSTPSTPSPPSPPPGGSVTLAPPVPRSPVGGLEIAGVRPRLEVTNSVATGNPGAVTYRFELSSEPSFPFDSRTVVMDGVAQGPGTTAVDVSVDLNPATMYHWRARAASGPVTSGFSPIETLRTENRGFRSGQTIYDPLTNGATLADERHGGQFITGPNGGWQPTSSSDSLDYDIPTCSSCQVEFDATNFGPVTPGQENVEPKWLSMGDGRAYDSFFAFRDDPWKMHIEKRADVPGAVKLIWRHGCNTSEACDNVDNPKIPIAWDPAKVYHFTLTWGGGSRSVSICEYNGSSCVATIYSDNSSGPYTPPNHRIEIGTRPRNETVIGVIFRNLKVSPR